LRSLSVLQQVYAMGNRKGLLGTGLHCRNVRFRNEVRSLLAEASRRLAWQGAQDER
jgi:hypothetical protein